MGPIKFQLVKRKRHVSAEQCTIPEELREFVRQWKHKKGNTITILHKVQSLYGYIPEDVAQWVCAELHEHVANIYGIITFYNLFKLKKPGKYKVAVCMGTACYLKGGHDIIEELQTMLGISVNQTAADGLFSLETVRCVGCCGLAPVIMINDTVYGNLKKGDVSKIIADLRAAETHEGELSVSKGASAGEQGR